LIGILSRSLGNNNALASMTVLNGGSIRLLPRLRGIVIPTGPRAMVPMPDL
jgi:hypothetical protein